MLVITAERLPHDPGTVLSEPLDDCMSWIVLAGAPGLEHWKPDPVHCVMTIGELELMVHV